VIPTRPSVSVVIPTHERKDTLLRALNALAHQDLPSEELEVVVSLDGGSEATLDALAALRTPYVLRLTNDRRRGRAGACNAAIREARGEVIVILDDDMAPEPNCLSNHARHHPAGSRVCVMGAAPVQVGPTQPPAARYVAAKFNSHLKRLAEPGRTFRLRDFYSGNTSVRRDVLDDVGPFDERFTRYGNEDLELFLRLRSAGVEIRYDPDARASQEYGKTLDDLARDTCDKGHTAVLLARSHDEAFQEMQLATYHAHSGRWLSVRAALLAANRRYPAFAGAVVRVAQLLERVGAGHRPFFYVFLLDYLYWSGVQAALLEGQQTGPLAQLAADLRDGPIRLLLHR
jgi:GT2 family glycosyltransferase